MKSSASTAMGHRVRRSGRTGTILLALLVACLGVPVYLLGAKTPPAEMETAEAIVRLPADVTTQRRARREILAETNVRRAIRACWSEGRGAEHGCPERVESVRDRLNVRLSTPDAPNTSTADVHVACTYWGAPATEIALVNRLAEQFAQSVRQRQKAEATQAYRKAQRATAKAQEKLTEAEEQLDQFVQECLEGAEQRAVAEEADRGSAANPPEPNVNPDWSAVRRQLDHARQYRSQLLIDRTPLHPMVRAADTEIEDLEKRLEAIPHELVPAPGNLAGELRQMTDPLPQPPGLIGAARQNVDTLEQPLGRFVPPTTSRPAPGAQPPSTQPADPPAFVSRKRLGTFLGLRRDVDAAQRNHEHALARQREAWQCQFNLPPVKVVAARVVTSHAMAPRRSPRLAIVSLIVALAGAAGVGMVATGISGNVTFTDTAQARAALPVPVLATVPGADHGSTESRRHRFLEGVVVAVCGLFLLAVCAGVLLAASGVVRLF